MTKWFLAESATKADVPDYHCLGFNAHWSKPSIRIGFYDVLREGNPFVLLGGIPMELAPTHVARLPNEPDGFQSTIERNKL